MSGQSRTLVIFDSTWNCKGINNRMFASTWKWKGIDKSMFASTWGGGGYRTALYTWVLPLPHAGPRSSSS